MALGVNWLLVNESLGDQDDDADGDDDDDDDDEGDMSGWVKRIEIPSSEQVVLTNVASSQSQADDVEIAVTGGEEEDVDEVVDDEKSSKVLSLGKVIHDPRELQE